MKAIQPDASRHDDVEQFPLPVQSKEIHSSEYERQPLATGSAEEISSEPTCFATPEMIEYVNGTRNRVADAPDAVADSLAHDMVERQGLYADAAKPSMKRGIVLTVLGVLALIAAVAFFMVPLLSQPVTIKMTQVEQYEVPDGMLQEGTVDNATDVIYVYDLAESEAPYAVESHAISEGVLGSTDLYEEWDGSKPFSDEIRDAMVSGDASNYRKIVIHLPVEAKGYIAGSSEYRSKK